MIHVKFDEHGLGDASNAAHLFAMYVQRGHQISVDCSMDKAEIFLAAGCEVRGGARTRHPWHHAHAPGAPQHHDHWSGSKIAWNISRSPLPNIGTIEERWNDLCNVKLCMEKCMTEHVRNHVGEYIDTLPRPVILAHTKGNTSPEKKNYPDELHFDLYREILERVGGCIVLLDWDSRVKWFYHGGVRHIQEDWHRPQLLELYELIRRADCLIGVDSGVLHYSRFTDTPAVGIWTHHYPTHFSLPRTNTVHILPDKWQDWTRRRRLAFNLIDVPGDVSAPADVAEVVAKMVAPRRFVPGVGPDVLLQHLVGRLRQTSDYHPYLDRHKTMGAFMELLKGPRMVVETGCIRAEDDWTAGFSTYLLGMFLQGHGGVLQSVDIDETNVKFARTWTAGLPVKIDHSDSRPWLRSYQGKIGGLYLDSADVDTPGFQQICLEECRAAWDHLTPDAPILIDDTPYESAGKWRGKGRLAVEWLLDHGYRVKLAGYQCLLTRETP